MKKYINTFKSIVSKNKRSFWFLFILFLVGLASGSLFITFISSDDKIIVLDQLNTFFDSIKNNSFDSTFAVFLISLGSNFIYIFIVWILGISVVGIPIIVFLHFFKGFLIGFSIGAIIASFKMVGIFISIAYIFPHHILMFFLSMFLSFYALSFSLMIFQSIIKKQTINFKCVMQKYTKVFLYSFIAMVFCSILEVFVSPFIIKAFVLIFT